MFVKLPGCGKIIDIDRIRLISPMECESQGFTISCDVGTRYNAIIKDTSFIKQRDIDFLMTVMTVKTPNNL